MWWHHCVVNSNLSIIYPTFSFTNVVPVTSLTVDSPVVPWTDITFWRSIYMCLQEVPDYFPAHFWRTRIINFFEQDSGYHFRRLAWQGGGQRCSLVLASSDFGCGIQIHKQENTAMIRFSFILEDEVQIWFCSTLLGVWRHYKFAVISVRRYFQH